MNYENINVCLQYMNYNVSVNVHLKYMDYDLKH